MATSHSAAPSSGEAQEVSLEAIAAGMEPFAPPADFVAPEELQAPPPRAVPKAVYDGPFGRSQKRTLHVLFILGLACVLFPRLEIVQKLSYYVLALGYLDWIGLALIAIGLLLAVRRSSAPQYRHVRQGVTTPARLLCVSPLVTGTREAPTCALMLGIEYRDPDTGTLKHAWARSADLGSLSSLPRYSVDAEPGAYVPAVGLPGRFEQTVSLYGLQGLNPAYELTRKDGRPIEPISTFTTILITVLSITGFGILMIVIDAFRFYSPEGGEKLPWIIGLSIGAVCGLALAIWMWRREASPDPTTREIQKAVSKRSTWLLASLAFTLFGAAGGFGITLVLNAKLDSAPGQFREIEVVQFWQETWYPLFIRNYEIEYHELPTGENEKRAATHEQIEEFMLGYGGVAEFASGAFGIRWIRNLHPVTLVEAADGEPEEEIMLTAEKKDDQGRPYLVGLKAAVKLPDGKILPVSPQLREVVRKRITEQMDEYEASQQSSSYDE